MSDVREPAAATQKPVRVIANLSAPRLGFTDPLVTMAQVACMGIELRKDSGFEWAQSLSRLLYKAVDEDFTFALVLDYDSVFRPGDVAYLLKLIMAHPEADAVFPVQYRREASELIVGIEKPVDGSTPEHLAPSPRMGHFGLTLLRVEALKALPHPWLMSVPGANGRWDAPDKQDADIWFWNRFRENGRKAFCAWRCVIGHAQQMITWPGENYEAVHQYCGAYFRDGDAPREVLSAAAARAAASMRKD